MCKFHEDVALDVATGPDGKIDPVVYALNTVALGSSFSIGDFIPAMQDVGGHDVYEIASHFGQKSFKDSGLVYDPVAMAAYRENTLSILQQKSAEIVSAALQSDDSLKRLRTKRDGVYYINKAPDNVFDGFSPDRNETAVDPRYQTIRTMAGIYMQDQQVQEILAERFRHSVATIFTEARDKANPQVLKAYERLPLKWRKYTSCIDGACSSAGGALLGHMGCVMKFALPALAGTGVMAHDPAVMYGLLGGGTALGIGLFEGRSYYKGKVPSRLQRYTTYGAALLTFGVFTALHLGDSDHHAQHEGLQQEKVTYFTSEDGRHFQVTQNMACLERTDENGVRREEVILLPPDTIQISFIPNKPSP